jgi:hypothetical protein
MKPLTIEQQQEAIRIIKGFANHVNNKLNDHIDLTDSAKRFANSLKPKYYIVQNQCGDFVFLAGINSWVKFKREALSFDDLDDAIKYRDTRVDNGYEYLIVVNSDL